MLSSQILSYLPFVFKRTILVVTVTVPGHCLYLYHKDDFILRITGQFFNVGCSLFGGIMLLQYNQSDVLSTLMGRKECSSQVIFGWTYVAN